MKTFITILFISTLFLPQVNQAQNTSTRQTLQINYFGELIQAETDLGKHIDLQRPLNEISLKNFYSGLNKTDYSGLISSLLRYKNEMHLDDWLFYQLIRRTAQQICPKAINYEKYTLYKWFLLVKCGYDAQLAISDGRLLFYVHSKENIYDIPLFENEGRQYVCLNIHDFDHIDLNKSPLQKVDIHVEGAVHPFSYRVKYIPDFKSNDLTQKDLVFMYHNKEDHFPVKFNRQLDTLFKNYPSVDFESYFNIPMSNVTYNSLLPLLKKKLAGFNQEKGVDYLMHFTRYAFPYENDLENFGKEKRLTPEQTMFYAFSDCDDRVALFFYLVKELYNLPMIALMYPDHITMAVAFDKPLGKPVLFEGKLFTVCEPTPQLQDLDIGQLPQKLRDLPFEVVYAYTPGR